MSEPQNERQTALESFANLSGGELSPPTSSRTTHLDHAGGPQVVHGAVAVAVQRDDAVVLRKLKALAAAAGQDWYYRFPVRNKRTGQTDWIEGPSIKLANDLARMYGNNETDIRVQDLGENWLFYARFVDLETGYSLTRPFQQRKSAGKLGGDDDARRLDQAFQIGASKAIRNVVVNALQTFADFAFEEAKNSLVERIGSDIENYRQRTVDRVTAKVPLKRVENVIGRIANDWLATDIAKVISMMRAVADGMATLDETFPPTDSLPPTDSPESNLDSFASGDSAAADAGPNANADVKPKGKGKPKPAPATSGTDAAESATGSAAGRITETQGTESDLVQNSNTQVNALRNDDAANDAAETKFQQLSRMVADATDSSTVHQIWENLGLDDYFNDDPFGRREAWKVCQDRIKALDGEGAA